MIIDRKELIEALEKGRKTGSERMVMGCQKEGFVVEAINFKGTSCRAHAPYTGVSIDTVVVPDRMQEIVESYASKDVSIELKYETKSEVDHVSVVLQGGKTRNVLKSRTATTMWRNIKRSPMSNIASAVKVASMTTERSQDETPMSTIFITKDNVASTDARIMSIVDVAVSEEPVTIAIPYIVARLISSTATEESKFSHSKDGIFWENKGVIYAGCVSSVNRPNMEAVGNTKGSRFALKIKLEDFEKALTLCHCIGGDSFYITCSDIVRVETVSQLGNLETEFQSVEFTGESTKIKLNLAYSRAIVRALKELGSEEVLLEQNPNPRTPIVGFEAIGKDGVACIAPMV